MEYNKEDLDDIDQIYPLDRNHTIDNDWWYGW